MRNFVSFLMIATVTVSAILSAPVARDLDTQDLDALIAQLRAIYPDVPATVPPGFERPASLPVGPALGPDEIVFDSDRGGNFELFAMAVDLRGVRATRALTTDPAYDSWWPRVSPDRRTIIFYRTPKGVHDLDYAKASLWAVGADGSRPTQLRPAGWNGWTLQGHAEFSPDGNRLVMFGGSRFNPQVFVTDRLGQGPVAVTNRPGANLDPVFSPDGRSIAFVGCPEGFCTEARYEIFLIPVGGGAAVQLTSDDVRDHDPYFSPDGRTLAWLSLIHHDGPMVWDIRVASVGDMDSARRLVGDRGVTSRPQWSADGQRIYMHRVAPGGSRWGIWSVRPDGTELVKITAGQPGNNEYPAT